MSSSVAEIDIVIRSRTLPFTLDNDFNFVFQQKLLVVIGPRLVGDVVAGNSIVSHNSDEMWREGFSRIRNVRIAEIGMASVPLRGMNAFTKIIICEIAVLKESDSMSSVTFLIVACMIFNCAFVRIDLLHRWRQLPFAGLIFLHDQTPDAGEKTRNTFHAAHAPRLHLLERPHNIS